MSALGWVGFLVAAGAGATARYLLDGWVQDRAEGLFPWGTFTVNITGCFVLGLVVGLGRHHGVGTTAVTIAGTGALGAYTTFSTFAVETVRLAEEGAPALALRNIGGSVVAGVASAAGLALAAAV